MPLEAIRSQGAAADHFSRSSRHAGASPAWARSCVFLIVLLGVFLLFSSNALATVLPAKITENTTLTAAGNPYTGTSTIEFGATLKVEPGVEFKAVSVTVKGTLTAEGTASEPIVITESNGNYTPLTFEPGSGASVLSHVEISKSGSETYVKPPIRINKASPTIKNSTIKNSGYHAIYIPEGGSPEIADNTILSSGGYGGTYKRGAIRYVAGKEVTGNVNIHGNYVEKCGGGIDVTAAGSSVTATSLGGNSVVQSESTALSYSGPELPDDITENTLTGNTNNYISFGGTITHSLTWKGTSKVRLSGGLTIASGATLQMLPGTYVINPNITINGTLIAEGTAEKPIVFTEASEKGKGLAFEPSSGASVLDQVEVSYLGSETYVTPAISVKKASPTIKNSTIRNASFYAINIPEGGSPEIADNTILSSGGYGGTYKRAAIRYVAGKEVGGAVSIHGNYVQKSGGGIEVSLDTATSASVTTLKENTVVETDGTAFSYSGLEVPDGITDNLLVGNTKNYISFGGLVTHSMTWTPQSKVRLTGVTVQSGATLTIEPGLYVINPLITVNGTLIAKGTAPKPIVFTEAASKGKALTFEPGSGASVLEYVEVSDVGSETYVTSGIRINKASPTITNSLIRDSYFYGIYVAEGGSPEIADNYIVNTGQPNGTYKREGIYYNANAADSGTVNIHDNLVEKSGGGIVVSVASSSSVTSTSLGGNVALENSSTGVNYSGPDIPADVTNNVLVANKNKIIIVSGTVAKPATWIDAGTRVAMSGGVTVASGVTLKLSQGLFFVSPNMTVKGTLNAEGSSSKPIVFTGANETNAGEWKSIVFEAGSGGSVLDHVEVAYGGNGTGVGMIEVKGSSPKITNSTIRKSVNYGIKVLESGSPTVQWNRFRANTYGVSYSGAGNLSAPSNDWGCASGPKPAGCGDSVTSNVSWKPAVQLPELAGHCRGQESQCGEGADPVSLATGALEYSHRDLLLTNKSDVPLALTRAYSSGSSADTGLGPGWSQSGLASATELESGEVLVVRQDGRQDLFEKTESGYKAPSGVSDTLAKVEGAFHLSTLDGMVYRFDASGRIASITDDHGLKTTYSYNGEGRLATITDPSVQTLTFTYNSSNHITSVKDSTGREVKYTYSVAGDLATVTDALGGATEYGYDALHRITSIKDARGNVILKNTYDSQGRVVEQRDGLENLWKLSYQPGETVVTEPEGGKITYGFDAQSRIVSETDQLGKKTTIAYDAAGNVKEVLKPGGAKWVFGHDSAGNLTSVEDPEGGGREYEYDAQNRLAGFIDALGNDWSYEWSAANDLTKIVDPEEGETILTYNESGQPLTVTDANGHETKFSYDSRGNRLSVTDPLEHKTSFEYDNRNYLTSKTAPGLKAETFERNALGDLLARTTPLGNKTKYAYDANGLPTQITDPAENVWKIAYNAMARPITYTDPLEQQTTVSYNGNLKPTKITNRRGKETTYAYDLANRITEVHGPEGWDWAFGYDARGNRTSVVDPRENETTYEYDLADRMTESDEPLAVTTEYGYDANGQLTSVIDPRGYTTTYDYDDLGRLVAVAQPLEKAALYSYDGVGNVLGRSTAAGTVEYEYDAADRLKEVSDGEATLRAFGYDNADRLTAATDAQGKEIEIAYNEDGRVASIDDGRGQSLTRTYDPRGYLTKQVDGRGTLEYSYDKLGRLTSLTDPQGKESSFAYDAEGGLTEVKRPGGIVTTNVFDNAGRLSESTTKAGEPATVLEALEYAYDPAGNVVSRTDARLEQQTTFAYDALGRLTEFNPPGEGSTAYGYDAASNRTSAGATTYIYNALNQLTGSSDGTTYSYDGAGRLIGKAKESEETTYSWDLFDHLASVESGAETASYAYDALGRLSERTSEAGTQIAHYGDLTDLPTYDTNGGGETTTAYVRGPRGLLSQRSGSSTSFPLADAHGDVTAIVGAAGEVASRQSYDPWGAQLSGPALEMGYLGAQQRRTDTGTGLIQMGVRSYSPSLGRFLTEDRVFGHVGFGTSFDRYAYAWDNPLNFYDLDGRDVCVPTPFGDACAEDAAEDVGNAAGDAANAAWNGAGNGAHAAGSAAEDAWGWTAPGRQWISDRSRDLVKQIDFSTNEFIAAMASSAGTAGMCGIMAMGATAVGTPAAGAAAAGLCATMEAVSTVETTNDIFDHDNGLWTDELFE